MALVNEVESESSTVGELLDAQAHLLNHIFNFINSMSLKCAIQLGIPNIIHKHGKPMTLDQLVDALHINKEKSQCVFRLMRILIHSKFFVKAKISQYEEKEGYWLTTTSRLLLRDQHLSMVPFALAVFHPILIDPWHHVSEWFQNDDYSNPPFVTKHKRTFWEYADSEPRWNEIFNEAMASDARFVISILIKECKQVFEGLNSMVDVGGGTGEVAKSIANSFPRLKCTVLDLPHVIIGLEGAHNLTFIGGDMFHSIPTADAVFLKWIFHDWNDEESVKLLKKCKEAIIRSSKGTGKVIIVETVLDDHKEDHKATETQLFLDMLMMINTPGKERTEQEWAKLFFVAGFKSYRITHVLGLRSIIEVFP